MADRTPGTGTLVGIIALALVLAVGIIAGSIYLRDPGDLRGDDSQDLAAEETTETVEVDFVATEATVALQEHLTELGYYEGPIDGDYGAATIDAVTRLQEDLGITADGRYGADTHKAMSEAEGMDPAVEFALVLQQGLKDLGYYDGEVDGAYGAGTAAAVEAFQTDYGLNVDGVAGPETVNALHGALEATAAEAAVEEATGEE